jgi:hypothetical protein
VEIKLRFRKNFALDAFFKGKYAEVFLSSEHELKLTTLVRSQE